MGDQQQGYLTIRARKPANGSRASSADSTYGSGSSDSCPSATHDISRVSYHVKHLDTFAQTLQDSANRAFPNRGRSSQRYKNVQALLLHWKCDDLFVLPELEDLEKCLRDDYSFETDIFAIPSENAHLELMMKIGAMIKEHESNDTLFVVYYGGHARIDESRQSTWCATRHAESPWLQWSAIQTLLERSTSDVLILLDCCAGAASATFPNGQSITETISASSWDAIAPDPGRYSFTNAVIEVLQEWRMRTFSAAMLHAEVLARLKHPRPITINGKHFEARSTPVHFMMTSNHKAPSIEISRIVPDCKRPPSPPQETAEPSDSPLAGRMSMEGSVSEPNEDEPHVMISLALEDDQRLDLSAWEQWLASFPALAKYVKVQGVFRSHSTLLLLSLPVMIWDLLPEDRACSFVAFIRSNNLMAKNANATAAEIAGEVAVDEMLDPEQLRAETESFFSGTTYIPNEDTSTAGGRESYPRLRPPTYHSYSEMSVVHDDKRQAPPPPSSHAARPGLTALPTKLAGELSGQRPVGGNIQGGPAWAGPRTVASTASLQALQRQQTAPASLPGAAVPEETARDEAITRTMILNQARTSKRTAFASEDVPEGPPLANHVVSRLEDYYQKESHPNVAVTEFLASNLGVETADIDLWFHHRRQQERMTYHLQNLKIDDHPPEVKEGPRMILPGHLNTLLEIFPPRQVLIVDLRSPTAFEKSHIYGAVNLRAPVSFIKNVNIEMIEKTFMDDESRRTFARWSQARCVVFYDRVVEFDWECPVAEALLEKFKKWTWTGHCFILKGHYREFSSSFDKYIVGDKMTQGAKDYVDGLRQHPSPTSEEISQNQRRYQEWLNLLETSDRVHTIELIPPRRAERSQAVASHQRELEIEFENQFPELHKKAIGLRPAKADPMPVAKSAGTVSDGDAKWKDEDDFDAKAPLVEPLARGLEKMQEAGLSGPTSPPSKTTYAYQSDNYADKLGDLPPSDDFDEIDPKDEQLRNDPAFQRAGNKALEATGDAGSKAQRRGREGPFWKRIRTGK